ncbi:MAG: VWA domain-containing protein [Chloroflexota bacterium]
MSHQPQNRRRIDPQDDQHEQNQSDSSSTSETVSGIGDPFAVRRFQSTAPIQTPKQVTSTLGRRTRQNNTRQGYVIRSQIPTLSVQQMSDIALAPTLRTAAIRIAGNPTQTLLPIQSRDLRTKVRAARVPNLILFVVDASGSMAARQRMTAVKGAILSLLIDAYQKRDKVGLITFRGQQASLVLPPTNSVELAQRYLAELPTGGRTPLSSGLMLAQQTLMQTQRAGEQILPLLVILSDGRANVTLDGQPQRNQQHIWHEVQQIAQQLAAEQWTALVIDCEQKFPRLHLANRLAAELGGECLQLDELSATTLTTTISTRLSTLAPS